MNSLDLVWGLALKDLKLTSRSLHSFLTTMFFAVLILVVFNFTFEPGSEATRESLPGILWVSLLFPGVIQLNRSFQIEQDQVIQVAVQIAQAILSGANGGGLVSVLLQDGEEELPYVLLVLNDQYARGDLSRMCLVHLRFLWLP